MPTSSPAIKQVAEPEWAREKFLEQKFGIGRMTLYRLRKLKKIRSTNLKQPGDKYGIRLFHVESVRRLIEESEERGEG